MSARLGDLAPALTRESNGIDEDARLYLVPSAKQLLSSDLASAGDPGRGGRGRLRLLLARAHPVHAGPWYARLNGMFGVEHQLGYGAPARAEGEQVTLTMVADFGTLAPGTQLRFAGPGRGPSHSYLPVRPDGAEVLAVDAHDRPALLRRQAGAGHSSCARTRSSTWPRSPRTPIPTVRARSTTRWPATRARAAGDRGRPPGGSRRPGPRGRGPVRLAGQPRGGAGHGQATARLRVPAVRPGWDTRQRNPHPGPVWSGRVRSRPRGPGQPPG